MNHICYLNKRTEDLVNLASGNKTMIIRGVQFRSAPYECVFPGDRIYFSHGKDNIVLRADVVSATNIMEPGPDELRETLNKNASALMLDPARQRKLEKFRYFTLLELGPVRQVTSLEVDVIIYRKKGFWLIVGESKQD